MTVSIAIVITQQVLLTLIYEWRVKNEIPRITTSESEEVEKVEEKS